MVHNAVLDHHHHLKGLCEVEPVQGRQLRHLEDDEVQRLVTQEV